MSDEIRAYTQAILKGTETWGRIHKEEWSKSWQGVRDPACPLRLALYGHPDSGSRWEHHRDTALKSVEFEAIPNLPGCYIHRRLSDFLVVYAYEFKLVAPKEKLQALWKLSGQKLRLEPPTPCGRFLGCETRSYDVTLNPSPIPAFHTMRAVRGPGGEEQSLAPRQAAVMEYDACSFMRSCVSLYEELTGRTLLQRGVHIIFLDDETNWVEGGERGGAHRSPCVC
jgi:hypothetical protein